VGRGCILVSEKASCTCLISGPFSKGVCISLWIPQEAASGEMLPAGTVRRGARCRNASLWSTELIRVEYTMGIELTKVLRARLFISFQIVNSFGRLDGGVKSLEPSVSAGRSATHGVPLPQPAEVWWGDGGGRAGGGGRDARGGAADKRFHLRTPHGGLD